MITGQCVRTSCYATGAFSLCTTENCPMQKIERSDNMNQDLAKVCALILLREGGWCITASSYSGENPNVPREGILRTEDENKKTQYVQEVNPFAETKEGYEQMFAIENWLHKNRQELLVESKLQEGLHDEPLAEYNGYNKRANCIEYCLVKLKEENEVLWLLGKAKLGDVIPAVGGGTSAKVVIDIGGHGAGIEIRHKDIRVATDIRKQLMAMIKIIGSEGDLND